MRSKSALGNDGHHLGTQKAVQEPRVVAVGHLCEEPHNCEDDLMQKDTTDSQRGRTVRLTQISPQKDTGERQVCSTQPCPYGEGR